MPITINTLQKVTLTSFVLLSLFSCSKDADLLSEYVINDNDDLQSLSTGDIILPKELSLLNGS